MFISFFNKILVYIEDFWIKKIVLKCLYEILSSIVFLMFNLIFISLCNKSMISLVVFYFCFKEVVCCFVV